MTFNKYEVEIDGLADFANFVEREVGENLRPGVDGIKADFPHGYHWGRDIRSDVVQQARVTYVAAQHASAVNLTKFITAAEVMVETIRRLMTMYESTEQMAGLALPDVDAVMDAVHREFNPTNVAIRDRSYMGLDES